MRHRRVYIPSCTKQTLSYPSTGTPCRNRLSTSDTWCADPTNSPRKPTYDALEAENAVLRRKVASLEEELGRLRRRVEELTRKGKRPASPFGKDKKRARPEKPGRKPGDEYGAPAW